VEEAVGEEGRRWKKRKNVDFFSEKCCNILRKCRPREAATASLGTAAAHGVQGRAAGQREGGLGFRCGSNG
jgi:hypothetical protein